MEDNIKLSVIIPWKSGDPVREKLLTNVLEAWSKQDDADFELLLVEQMLSGCSADDFYTEVVIPENFQSFQHFHIFCKEKLFNKSWCMNVGARKARYEHLIFCDADTLFGNDFTRIIKQGINQIPSPENKIMFCWNTLIYMPGKDNPKTRYIKPTLTAAMGGIWYVQKEFFFGELGGMNENFFGYGGEDNEMCSRAKQLLNFKDENLTELCYTLTHQYHDWVKPHENATPYFLLGRRYWKIINQRLKDIGVGDERGPRLIEIEDLRDYTMAV